MQIIPVVRPPSIETRKVEDAKTVAATKAVSPVGMETATVALALNQAAPVQTKREHEIRERKEEPRRRYCRRTRHIDFVEELRSTIDRRHKKQRKTDINDRIDEVA